MRLQEYIDNFNRLDTPKNFPYHLRYNDFISYSSNPNGVHYYCISLIVEIYKPDSLNEFIEVFRVNNKTNYYNGFDEINKRVLEQSIIDTFEKIKFQDTLRNLF